MEFVGPVSQRRSQRESCPLRGRIRRMDIRCYLGRGRDVFGCARRAVMNWKMFDVGWLDLCGSQSPPQVGQQYGIVSKCVGVRIIALAFVRKIRESCREDKAIVTLSCQARPHHVVAGRESFTVSFDSQTSDVSYRIRSCSRIVPVLRPFAIMVRAAQRRFASDSCAAMQRAVSAYYREMNGLAK